MIYISLKNIQLISTDVADLCELALISAQSEKNSTTTKLLEELAEYLFLEKQKSCILKQIT